MDIKSLITLMFIVCCSSAFGQKQMNLTEPNITLLNSEIDYYKQYLKEINVSGGRDSILHLIKFNNIDKWDSVFDISISWERRKSTIVKCLENFKYYYKYKNWIFLVVGDAIINSSSPSLIKIKSEGDSNIIYRLVHDDIQNGPLKIASRGYFAFSYTKSMTEIKGIREWYQQRTLLPKDKQIVDCYWWLYKED